MVGRAVKDGAATRAIRWCARLWSIATIGLVLLFLVGEPFHPTPKEWLGLIFFPFGICAGMIVAWRKEGLGGTITVGSLLVFYGVHFLTAGRLPHGWAWVVFAAPGFLFLLSWYRSRRGNVAPS